MSRSKWKPNFYDNKIWKMILNKKKKFKFKFKLIKFFKKNINIFAVFKNKYMYIHKGNTYKSMLINKYKYYRKLGNFVVTKKPFKFPEKKKKR
jgi:ribosomal protein S19